MQPVARRPVEIRRKAPALLQHVRVDDRHADQVLEALEAPEDQRAVRPGAGIGDVELRKLVVPRLKLPSAEVSAPPPVVHSPLMSLPMPISNWSHHEVGRGPCACHLRARGGHVRERAKAHGAVSRATPLTIRKPRPC